MECWNNGIRFLFRVADRGMGIESSKSLPTGPGPDRGRGRQAQPEI
jgi:hypothetical protein